MTNSGFGRDDQNGQNQDWQNGQNQDWNNQGWQDQNGTDQNDTGQGGYAPWQDQPQQAPWQPEPPADQGGYQANTGASPEPFVSVADGQADSSYGGGEHPPVDSDGNGFADETVAADEQSYDDPPLLALEDDVRLPWLEGDDEEDEEQSGIGQGMLLVLLGIVALALIAGSVFWISRDKPDENLVADGGVIAAPKEPYKTKPKDAGGEVVAGTGDTSFAVAEGESRTAQIGGAEQPAQPGFTAPVTKKDDAGTAKADAPASAPVNGPGVQVGAYSSKDSAEKGWTQLQQRYPALSGVSHRVIQGQADIGTVYRLQAVPGDVAAARSLCASLKSSGLSCQVKD